MSEVVIRNKDVHKELDGVSDERMSRQWQTDEK